MRRTKRLPVTLQAIIGDTEAGIADALVATDSACAAEQALRSLVASGYDPEHVYVDLATGSDLTMRYRLAYCREHDMFGCMFAHAEQQLTEAELS